MRTRWVNRYTGQAVTRIGTLLPKTRKVLLEDSTGATYTMEVGPFRRTYIEIKPEDRPTVPTFRY